MLTEIDQIYEKYLESLGNEPTEIYFSIAGINKILEEARLIKPVSGIMGSLNGMKIQIDESLKEDQFLIK